MLKCFLYIFLMDKNNSTTTLQTIKNKLMNNVIHPTGAGTTDPNDPNVTLPLANDEITNLI